jgi:hypothetical protein
MLGLWSWVLMGPIYVRAMRPEPDRITDFYQDWASARNHWVGLPVYTLHTITFPRYLGLPPDAVGDVTYNAHPPTSVFLVLPLGRLDYPDAVLAWNLISLTALAAGLAIVAAVFPVPRTFLAPLLAVLPFCHPVLGNLIQGQLTLVLVLLVTAIWALERSGRPGAAGLLLGLAAAIKLYPAYLAVFFAVRGQLRALLAAAVSLSVLTLVTAAVLGMDTYHDYRQIVLPYLGRFQPLSYNFSFTGFWHKLFDPAAQVVLSSPSWASPTLARWGTLLSDLVVTVIVAALVLRARTPERRDLAFGASVTAMLLVSPITWDISLVLLLVPIAVIARNTGRSRWVPTALVLILAIIYLPQNAMTELALAGWTNHTITPDFILGAASLKFYALLGTFFLGLAAFRAAE